MQLKNILILASVVVTGASVLVLEIVAIRILSPYYGNTLYTASSVIGIVLAALSVGYYFGGKLADRFPLHRIFYGIIFISGILVVTTEVLASLFLPEFGTFFSITTGPLFSSAFLFFVPSFTLGLLSPFAVRLHKFEENAVGSRSGEVFFWSTMGSIAGSWLAGFVLIPRFGVYHIVIGTGILLSIWGLAGVLASYRPRKSIIALMVFFLAYQAFLSWVYLPKPSPGVVYEKDGVYERIKIIDGIWNHAPVRYLFQDKSYSAAMFLESDELVFDYTKYYKLYSLFRPQAQRAFVIGGGAYSIPKAFLKDSPAISVDVAEIEPDLYELSKEYFLLEDDKRLHNHVEDGRHFLARNETAYDVIVGDAYYSLFSVPIHLTTREFFGLARDRLTDNGIFVGNFGGYLSGQGQAFLLSEIKTFRNVFPNSYFFAVVSPHSTGVQNVIFLGINGEKTIDFQSEAIVNSPDPIMRNLAQKNINLSEFDLTPYRELTDDYAPIEHLVSKMVKQWQ